MNIHQEFTFHFSSNFFKSSLSFNLGQGLKKSLIGWQFFSGVKIEFY